MLRLAHRVNKLTRKAAIAEDADRASSEGVLQLLCRLQIVHAPGIELVLPEDTDADTYAKIRATLAAAKGDHEPRRRLHREQQARLPPPPPEIAVDPSKHAAWQVQQALSGPVDNRPIEKAIEAARRRLGKAGTVTPVPGPPASPSPPAVPPRKRSARRTSRDQPG